MYYGSSASIGGRIRSRTALRDNKGRFLCDFGFVHGELLLCRLEAVLLVFEQKAGCRVGFLSPGGRSEKCVDRDHSSKPC